MCRKHCKNHSPRHILQKPLATRKTKPNRKIRQKGLEKQCQKNKKKRIHFGADFDSKIMDFRQFSTSGTPRSAQNAPPGALSENASNSDGFWDAFFRIFMDLGSQIGGQKGSPEKQLLNFLYFFTTQNGIFQIFRILMDFTAIFNEISGFFYNFSIFFA